MRLNVYHAHPTGPNAPAGPPGPTAFLPDVRAAIADHEARWAAGATSSSPAGALLDGHLRPPFDDAMVREGFLPGMREEIRRAVDEKMRPLLAELKARCWSATYMTRHLLLYSLCCKFHLRFG